MGTQLDSQLKELCEKLRRIEGVVSAKKSQGKRGGPWSYVQYILVTVHRGENHGEEKYRVDLFKNHEEVGRQPPEEGFRIVALSKDKNKKGKFGRKIAEAQKTGDDEVTIKRESISVPCENASKLVKAFEAIAAGEGFPASEKDVRMQLVRTPAQGWELSDLDPESYNAHPDPAYYESLVLDLS